jgi:hypothetical protein
MIQTTATKLAVVQNRPPEKSASNSRTHHHGLGVPFLQFLVNYPFSFLDNLLFHFTLSQNRFAR